MVLTPTQVQIFLITGFLSVTWGIYLVGTVREYVKIRSTIIRRRQDLVVALRRVVVAICVWLFVFSFCFRIICTYFGVNDEISAQLVFFSLLGSNVVGSLFAVVSLRYD